MTTARQGGPAIEHAGARTIAMPWIFAGHRDDRQNVTTAPTDRPTTDRDQGRDQRGCRISLDDMVATT